MNNIRYILWVTLKLYPVIDILWITLKLYPVGDVLFATLKLYSVGNGTCLLPTGYTGCCPQCKKLYSQDIIHSIKFYPVDNILWIYPVVHTRYPVGISRGLHMISCVYILWTDVDNI